MPQVGDFVTAVVDLPEPYPIRQGIYLGEQLLTEDGRRYKIVEVDNIVGVIWGSALDFVNNFKYGRIAQR